MLDKDFWKVGGATICPGPSTFKGTSGGPKCTIPVPMEAYNLWSHVIDIPLNLYIFQKNF